MLFDFGDGNYIESGLVTAIGLVEIHHADHVSADEGKWAIQLCFSENVRRKNFGPYSEDEALSELRLWVKALNAMNGGGGAPPMPGSKGGPLLKDAEAEKRRNALKEMKEATP